jgi:AcrR family transcriptional regulator
MSQVAEQTGIGRATLYKYFPDVGSILVAWHERQIHAHLRQLAETRDAATDPGQRLAAVLHAFAVICHESRGHRGTDLGAFLHHDGQVARATNHLHAMVRELVADAAATGDTRDDVSPDELATYCLHALEAAGGLRSKAAVGRLVAVTLTGLRPPR